ncbi:MAG: PadR family transcriptional regulator [Clostridium sp.]
MELSKETIKGHIESIILATLKEDELYGYDILKRIKNTCENSFEIKEGTLYVVLKRLENNGLVTSFWGNEESGGGRRRYFRITNKGQEYLNNKKNEWEFLNSILQIFFMEV